MLALPRPAQLYHQSNPPCAHEHHPAARIVVVGAYLCQSSLGTMSGKVLLAMSAFQELASSIARKRLDDVGNLERRDMLSQMAMWIVDVDPRTLTLSPNV
ncbi:hypothetical protein AB6A68_00715 [Ferrimicrobium acidiphilum]|uniref:Uncharacterized protein n=1 Tax=Ferrimicrobium acidiphilum TaxID=121039 RepID=A0ABV3Y082_9ACTN